MKTSLINASALSPELLQDWCTLLAGNPLYRSPYYHPLYAQSVAACGQDVQILLLHQDTRLVGVLPFQLQGGRALPVGGALTDYQGPVLQAGLEMPAGFWPAAMQVRYYGYDHMPAQHGCFSQHAWQFSRSLQLDLSGGYPAYLQRLQQRDASVIKKAATNARKLGNQQGLLKFEFDSLSEADFTALLNGKSEQFRRTLGAAQDIFAQPWIAALMRRLFATRQPDFGGVLSTLYAGEQLVAAHFGIRSGSVLHYWFPWYDTRFAGYSPGLILLANCAEQAAAAGLQMIDLGRGDQEYKQRFATGEQALCEGAVSVPMLLADLEAVYRRQRHQLRQSALGQTLRNWKQRVCS